MAENDKRDTPNLILKLYRESVKNMPILKYSWSLIAAICILALIGFFQLKNKDVFFYVLAVLFISFLGFVLLFYRFLLKKGDKVIRIALYIFIYSLIVTMCAAVLGFGSFIFTGKPHFYKNWFPNEGDSLKTYPIKIVDTQDTVKPQIEESKKNTKVEKNKSKTRKLDTNDLSSQDNQVSFSNESLKLTVLPFEYISNDSKYSWLSRGIPESILGAISQIENYVIIEAVQRDRILKEIDFQQGKYVDIKSACKLGNY